MGCSVLILALVAASSPGVSIPKPEVDKQSAVFGELWNDDFVWKFSDLPTSGNVPKARIPYSGYIYLDKEGGTAGVLTKYDEAVNQNYSYPATSWERADTSAAAARRIGRFFRSYTSANHWYGHCNGWTSAAIRHAEPQRSVTAQGVEFSPADIKGLLAEVYMYNKHELLAGYETNLNAGSLHAILANWLGRGSHPVAMDADPSEEKWNYPIYGFASSFAYRSPREVEVRTNIVHSQDTQDREYQQSPRLAKTKSFHYMLELNARGEIVGGYYFTDSDRIDFLWVPLAPRPSGDEGNERGNPHLDVETVLALWRKSVPTEDRRQWLIVDPLDRDRAVEVPDPNHVLPRNIRIVPPRIPVDAVAGE